MKKINTGFLGFGKSANRYNLPFLDLTDKFKVLGAYSRSYNFEMPYPLPENFNFYKDVDSLLNDSNIDLIIISSPSHMHFEHALACLQAGKHIVVEKPLCETVNEVEALYSLAKEKNLKIIPYQNRRFDSDFLTMQKALETIDFGQVFEIESNHSYYRPENGKMPDSRIHGSVYGHAVHFIDQIISYFGAPKEVLSDVHNEKNIINDIQVPESIDDYYDIKFIYPQMSIRIHFSTIDLKPKPRWTIRGSKAYFEKINIDQQERDLKQGIFPKSAKFGVEYPEQIAKVYYSDYSESFPTVYGGYELYYEEVYKHLNGFPSLIASYEQVKTVVGIMEVITQTQITKKECK